MPYSKMRIKAVLTAGLCAAMTLSGATIALAEKVPVESISAVVKSDDASSVTDARARPLCLFLRRRTKEPMKTFREILRLQLSPSLVRMKSSASIH